MLRSLNFVLCLAMLGVAVAHLARPDWWLWLGAFVVPAFWAFVAGFRKAFGVTPGRMIWTSQSCLQNTGLSARWLPSETTTVE